MKTALCIVTAIVACLHAYAATAQMKKAPNKTSDILMIAGAAAAIIGTLFCWMSNGLDWLIAALGFALIAYAAIQNGRTGQSFHIQHHIVRISVFLVLVVGFYFI